MFFTNESDKALLNKFKGVFEINKNIEFFDALVDYSRASGYYRRIAYLNDVPKIRILVGIDFDKIFAKYNSKGYLFLGDQPNFN